MGLNIFKGKLDIGKVFTTTVGMIDDTRFTPEEASRVNMMKAEKTMEFAAKAADENSIRSKARRTLAFMVMGCTIAMAIAGVVFAAIGNPTIVQAIVDIAKAFNLGIAFISVIAFYFGGYYMNKETPWSKKVKEVKTK